MLLDLLRPSFELERFKLTLLFFLYIEPRFEAIDGLTLSPKPPPDLDELEGVPLLLPLIDSIEMGSMKFILGFPVFTESGWPITIFPNSGRSCSS